MHAAALRVEIELVPLPAYPGGVRPSARVVIDDHGQCGRGEHVAWEESAHRAFAGRAAALAIAGQWTVASFLALPGIQAAPAYERAALECAVIDLALRQAGLSMFEICGRAPRAIRYVASCDARRDGFASARLLRRHGGRGLELKVDVGPDWDTPLFEQLAALAPIAIVDFKGKANPAAVECAHRALPDALLEDPEIFDSDPLRMLASLTHSQRMRTSLDARILSPADVPTAESIRPAAINVKIPRMGGVRAALRALAQCESVGIETYVGGMFEVDVGRSQARVLAALFCPDGPNDLAPLAAPGGEPEWPARLAVADDGPGFAAEAQ